MPHCLDEGSVEAIKVEACDGKNWENFIAENPEIQQRSKKKNWEQSVIGVLCCYNLQQSLLDLEK